MPIIIIIIIILEIFYQILNRESVDPNAAIEVGCAEGYRVWRKSPSPYVLLFRSSNSKLSGSLVVYLIAYFIKLAAECSSRI